VEGIAMTFDKGKFVFSVFFHNLHSLVDETLKPWRIRDYVPPIAVFVPEDEVSALYESKGKSIRYWNERRHGKSKNGLKPCRSMRSPFDYLAFFAVQSPYPSPKSAAISAGKSAYDDIVITSEMRKTLFANMNRDVEKLYRASNIDAKHAIERMLWHVWFTPDIEEEAYEDENQTNEVF
jgi:hypothetical protein